MHYQAFNTYVLIVYNLYKKDATKKVKYDENDKCRCRSCAKRRL